LNAALMAGRSNFQQPGGQDHKPGQQQHGGQDQKSDQQQQGGRQTDKPGRRNQK
jgi:hypothetical protein